MKMMPIKFRAEYADDAFSDDVQAGFAPFKNDAGEHITKRCVEIEPRKWDCGAALSVTIMEHVFPAMTQTPDGTYHCGREFDRSLHSFWIYNNICNPESYSIVPTEEQGLLIQALQTGDLRGNYAETIVNSLYVDLVVLHPESKFEEYLPRVKKFWQDWYAECEAYQQAKKAKAAAKDNP